MKIMLTIATVALTANVATAQTDFNNGLTGVTATGSNPGATTSIDRGLSQSSATTSGTTTLQGSNAGAAGNSATSVDRANAAASGRPAGGYSINGGNTSDAAVPASLSSGGGSSAGYSLSGGNVYSAGTPGVAVMGTPGNSTSSGVTDPAAVPPSTASGTSSSGSSAVTTSTAVGTLPNGTVPGTTSTGTSGTTMLGAPPANGGATPSTGTGNVIGNGARTTSGQPAGTARSTVVSRASALQFSEGTTPGWSLMTAAERKAYTDRAHAFSTVSECQSYNQLHLSEMQVRAKARNRALGAATSDPCLGIGQQSSWQ